MSHMSHPTDYRLVIYESQNGLQIGHRWVSHGSRMCQGYVAYRSQDRLQTGQKWITDESWVRYRWITHESHVGQTLLHMDLGWVMGWFIDGSYMGVRWVKLDHIWVIHWLTFLIVFSKLTNLGLLHNLTTLRIRNTKNWCNFHCTASRIGFLHIWYVR